jgi:glutaredoxin
MLRALLALALLAAATAPAQGLYRWSDAQGRIHYSSEPPPGVKAAEVRARTNTYAAPAPARSRNAARAKPVAAAAVPVVMYATSWCPYCAKARAYFGRNGIAYTEHDIEKSPAARAEFKRLGGRGVPLILVGRERVNGFDELAFEFALQKAAR